MTTLPTIPELFQETGELWKKQTVPLIKLAFFYFLSSMIMSLTRLPGLSGQSWTEALDLLLFIVSAIITSWVTATTILQIASGEKVFTNKVFSNGYDYSLKYFFLTVVSMCAISGSAVLFIIPGIMMLFWLSMSGYVLVLQQKGVIESIYTSWWYVKKWGWLLCGRLLPLYIPYLFVFMLPFIFSNNDSFVYSFFYQLIFSGIFIIDLLYSYNLYRRLTQDEDIVQPPTRMFRSILSISITISVLFTSLIVFGLLLGNG